MIKTIITSFLAFFCVVFLTGCKGSANATDFVLDEDTGTVMESADRGDEALEDIVDGSNISKDKEELFVFVCGAVNTPGVYKFAEGTRIYEAINTAGGFNDEADQRFLNLAESLKDGQQLYVPTVSETSVGNEFKDATAGSAQGQDGDGLVNINTADAGELTTINGIGQARAADIISYREQNGSFSSVEDIMKVPGIKDGLFNKIKDKITV